MRVATPFLGWAAFILAGLGLWNALILSPADYQHGENVRLLYVHVPAAWLAVFSYACLAGFSLVALVWRNVFAGLAMRAVLPVCLSATFVTLATGSIWGKTAWGGWWVWDARLSSVLVMFLMLLGIRTLLEAFDDAARGERAAQILALAGSLNLPIVKFSVDWWNTLHQPASLLRIEGPALANEMLWPLLLMMGAAGIFALWIVGLRLQNEWQEHKNRNRDQRLHHRLQKQGESP